MRTLTITVLLMGTSLGAFAAEPVDRELIPEARRVLEYLESQYGKKTLAGSTSGVAPFVYEATGRLPAIQGFDLSGWNSPAWGKTYSTGVRSREAARYDSLRLSRLR